MVENATRAWDMAFYGLAFKPGDRILTARAEYASNVIAFLQVAARTGAVIEVVDNDETGQLSVADLRRRLDDGNGPVKLVAITHVPTKGGLVNPAEEVGAAAREAGVPLPARRLPVRRATAHRRRTHRLRHAVRDRAQVSCAAPRGTGFLYVRRGVLDQIDPPFLDLHAATWTAPDRYEIRPDARRFENWETNYAAKIGLGVAVDYALSWGLPAIEARITQLADHLRQRLAVVNGVSRSTTRAADSAASSRSPSTAFPRPRYSGSCPCEASTSASPSPTTPGSTCPARGLTDVVRASVHYYNTHDELDRLIEALPAAR